MAILILLTLIFVPAYFLPTIIACVRDVPQKGWIFFGNTFFGWTGLGYLLMYVAAWGPSRDELQRAAERERLAEEADRAIVMMERRSREALGNRS